MASESFPIEVDQRGSVVIWTIDREARQNSLSGAVLDALGKLAHEAATNESIRAVIITGRGDKVFCAGADLKERQSMSEDDVRARMDLYRTALDPIDRCPKPVIAALNGLAFGGGFELALVCDLRIAAAHVTIKLPETGLGVIPGAGGTQRLPRLIGEARAKEMILLNRVIDAETALAWGIVNRIAPAGTNLIDDALSWITPIADGAPRAQTSALEALDRSFDVTLDVGLELEKVAYLKTLTTEDRREALKAFAEKRKPVFTGR